MPSTTEPATQQPTYRIRKERRADVESASYRHSLTVLDERSHDTLATCDLFGRASTSELTIHDASGERWRLTPNRSVLPSLWTLTDGAGRVAVQIDGQPLRKLWKPVERTALVVSDGTADEPLRVSDTTSNLAELALGFNPGDWSVLRGDATVGRLTRLRLRQPRAKGLRGWLLGVLEPSDRAVVSYGDGHVLSAPAALAMVALFEDFTNAS